MALPAEYLKLSPEQQQARLSKALGAYKRADPSDRRQKAREALIEEMAEQSPPKTQSLQHQPNQ